MNSRRKKIAEIYNKAKGGGVGKSFNYIANLDANQKAVYKRLKSNEFNDNNRFYTLGGRSIMSSTEYPHIIFIRGIEDLYFTKTKDAEEYLQTYEKGGGVGENIIVEGKYKNNNADNPFYFSSPSKGIDILSNHKNIEVLSIGLGKYDLFYGYDDNKQKDGQLYFGKWNNGKFGFNYEGTIKYAKGGSIEKGGYKSKKELNDDFKRIIQAPRTNNIYESSGDSLMGKMVTVQLPTEEREFTTKVSAVYSDMFKGSGKYAKLYDKKYIVKTYEQGGPIPSVQPYDEDKYTDQRAYLKELITNIFGKENSYSGSADWGGIPVWTVKGDKYQGTFIIIDDNGSLVLMKREITEEEHIDEDLMTAEWDNVEDITALLNKAKSIKSEIDLDDLVIINNLPYEVIGVNPKEKRVKVKNFSSGDVKEISFDEYNGYLEQPGSTIKEEKKMNKKNTQKGIKTKEFAHDISNKSAEDIAWLMEACEMNDAALDFNDKETIAYFDPNELNPFNKKKAEEIFGKKMEKGGSIEYKIPQTEKEKREVYKLAFGKEYDSEDRKQIPLPIDIATTVAMRKLETDNGYEFYADGNKMAKGGSIDDFTEDESGNYKNAQGYQLINQLDDTYQVLDPEGTDISGEYETLEQGMQTIMDYMSTIGDGGVDAKLYYVVGKKKGQLVDVSTDSKGEITPFTKEDAKIFAKSMESNYDYNSIEILPYRGKNQRVKMEKGGSVGKNYWLDNLSYENAKKFAKQLSDKANKNVFIYYYKHGDSYAVDTKPLSQDKKHYELKEVFERSEYAKGGSVGKEYKVFNYTDNIYATDETFTSLKSAKEFIKEFRKRFEKQGYYRDNRMNKVNPKDIDLLVIPGDFNPFKKMAMGGSVIDRRESMLRYVMNDMPEGTIENITGISDPKTIDSIHNGMISFLQRHGDRRYAETTLKNLIKDAQVSVVGRPAMAYAKGGGIGTLSSSENNPKEYIKKLGFDLVGKTNYSTSENGINYYVGTKKEKAIVVAFIEDEDNYTIDKKDAREMSASAKTKGIETVELYTNYGIELRSSEKSKDIGFDKIFKVQLGDKFKDGGEVDTVADRYARLTKTEAKRLDELSKKVRINEQTEAEDAEWNKLVHKYRGWEYKDGGSVTGTYEVTGGGLGAPLIVQANSKDDAISQGQRAVKHAFGHQNKNKFKAILTKSSQYEDGGEVNDIQKKIEYAKTLKVGDEFSYKTSSRPLRPTKDIVYHIFNDDPINFIGIKERDDEDRSYAEKIQTSKIVVPEKMERGGSITGNPYSFNVSANRPNGDIVNQVRVAYAENIKLAEEKIRTHLSDKLGYKHVKIFNGREGHEGVTRLQSLGYKQGGGIGNIDSDIQKAKTSLIKKAKSKGLYEYFGQKEVRELQDKYGYNPKVNQFDDWVMDFDLNQVSQYEDGGEIRVNDISAELQNFDIDNLDAYESREYKRRLPSLGKVGSLQVIINDVEGDYTQLSPELAELAEKQISIKEWEKDSMRRMGYKDGGSIDEKLYYVVGKKKGQLVDVSTDSKGEITPFTKEDAKIFAKSMESNYDYNSIEILPYRGKNQRVKMEQGGPITGNPYSFNVSANRPNGDIVNQVRVAYAENIQLAEEKIRTHLSDKLGYKHVKIFNGREGHEGITRLEALGYKDGGSVSKKHFVGIFNEAQLKKGQDKVLIEKAQKETELKYVDSKIIKKGGKMLMEVYLITDEEYLNSNKFEDGGSVEAQTWTIRDNDDIAVGSYLDEAKLISWAKQLAKENGENIEINSSKEAIAYIEKRDEKGEQDFEVYDDYANGGSVSKRGGNFNVGDKVMVDDSGYLTSFHGFDLSKPATILSKHKVKTSQGVKYTYGLELADGRKPFNSAMENKLTLANIMEQGGKIDRSINLDPKANLRKELNSLQRDLNSQRLGTYTEGDNSKEAVSRKKERETKLNRFNEVLKLLRENETIITTKNNTMSKETQEKIEKLKKGINNSNVSDKHKEMMKKQLAELEKEASSAPAPVKKSVPKQVVAKAPAKVTISNASEEDCAELIAQRKKAKKAAKERAAGPQKTPATKNKEKIEKVENDLTKRIKSGDVSQEELKKLKKEAQDLISLIDKYLK